MQALVKDGHGFAFIREGTSSDEELTTRPLAGVDWTVDTALIYRKARHPKKVPVLVTHLGRQLNQRDSGTASSRGSVPNKTPIGTAKRSI